MNLTTQCVYVDDNNTAWFFSNEFNGLFKFNFETSEIKYIRSFEEEEFFCSSLYTDCFNYKEKLVFIPCCAKKIAIFNFKTYKVKYIPIRDEDYIVYFNTVTISENKLLLFPVVYSLSAYILNLETEELEIIKLDYGNYDDKFSKYKERPLMCGKAIIGNVAYFVIYGTDKYMSFDIERKKIEILTQFNQKKMHLVRGNGDKLDFLNIEGNEIQRLSNKGEYINTIHLHSCKNTYLFSDGYSMSYGVIYPLSEYEYIAIPFSKNPICIAKKEGYKLINLEWSKIDIINNGLQPFVIAKKYRHNIVIFPYQSDSLIEIDTKTHEVLYYKLQIELDSYINIIKKLEFYLKKTPIYENNLSLKLYLRTINKNYENSCAVKEVMPSNGELIHEMIIKNIKEI